MRDNLRKLWLRGVEWFGSPMASWVLVGLFGVSAAWIALSTRYPMAFDEAYHVGLIRAQAGQLSPILQGAQPQYLDEFGAVMRNNSYLYHYLMSFPWRLIAAVTGDFAAQVVLMRLLNVALFMGGLVVWLRVVLALRPSRALANLVLALVVLTPVTSLLAGQINYDNLLFGVAGVFVLLAVRVLGSLRAGRFDTPRVLALLATGMLASLVKYPFIPIAVTVVVHLGLVVWQQWRHKRKAWWHEARRSWRGVGRWPRYALMALVVVAALLCLERFGLNFVRYGSPVPECNQVLSIERCHAYSPWERNYRYTTEKPAGWQPDVVGYVFFWTRRVIFNLLFVLSGPDGGYAGLAPILWPKLGFLSLVGMGTACMVLAWRRLLRQPAVPMLLGLCAAYMLVLYIQNFSEYAHMGQPVAVQGRYLVPILPLLYFVLLLAVWLQLEGRVRLRQILATVLVLGFLCGGGLLTYLVRTDASWYWSNSIVLSVNQKAQTLTRLLIPADSVTEIYTRPNPHP